MAEKASLGGVAVATWVKTYVSSSSYYYSGMIGITKKKSGSTSYSYSRRRILRLSRSLGNKIGFPLSGGS